MITIGFLIHSLQATMVSMESVGILVDYGHDEARTDRGRPRDVPVADEFTKATSAMKNKDSFGSKFLELMCRFTVIIGFLGLGLGVFSGPSASATAIGSLMIAGAILISGGLIALVLYWKQ